MSSLILKQFVPINNTTLFNDNFKNYIEYLLPTIMKKSTMLSVSDGTMRNRNEGNFYKLLQELSVVNGYSQDLTYDYYWIVLRLNGYTSPTQYTSDVEVLYIPDMQSISTYLQNYASISN